MTSMDLRARGPPPQDGRCDTPHPAAGPGKVRCLQVLDHRHGHSSVVGTRTALFTLRATWLLMLVFGNIATVLARPSR